MSVTKKIPIERFDNTKLDSWCAEHSIRKAALARKMGYSESSLYFKSLNNKYISAGLYNLLCYFCNVPDDYFLLPEKAKEEPKVTKLETDARKLETDASELAEIKKTLSEILKSLQNIEKELI